MDRARPVTSPPRGEFVRWRLPEPPAMLRHRPQDPWCSGPTCQPVTLEIAGSNPVGSAITSILLTPRPPARTGRSLPADGGNRPVRYPAARDRPRSRLRPGRQAPRGTPVVARPGRRRRARPRRGRRLGASSPGAFAGPRVTDAASSPRADRDAGPRPRSPTGGGRQAPAPRHRHRRRRRRARRVADVAIVPVANFRSRRTAATRDGRARHPGAATAPLQGARPRASATPSDPRRARPRPRRARRRAHDVATAETLRARTAPRTASGSRSCARTTSSRRSGRSPGAARRCSASTGSRTSPSGR